MSIRRKLFLAFALVAAISSAALLLLARSYVASERAQLDRRFLDDARAGFRRDDVVGRFSEMRVFQAVADFAREPDVLNADSGSETTVRRFMDKVPSLTEVVVWDASKQALVRTIVAPGSTPPSLTGMDIAALLAGAHRVWNEHRIVVNDTFEKFAVGVIGSDEAPRGFVLAPLDSSRFCTPVIFGREGRALLLDGKSGRLWHAPDVAAGVRESLPGFDRLLAQLPQHGDTADVDDGHGRRYRLYAAVSSETPLLPLNGRVEAIALIPLDELYAPLARIRLRVFASVGATILLAFLAALLLSGRFVGDIERIRAALAAFAQGDWRRLEKSSRDELGGALVDSINNMAITVAERMRRDEAESWRSLVRVVSHEINNTLAPIRSVAASLRSGLPRRLRDEDAGADVDMALKLIVERVDALATFIDGYAEVAKLPPPNRKPTAVDELVRGATALFAAEAAHRQVTIDASDVAGGTVEIDAQQMERVLVNVIKNAVEAAPQKGNVMVSVERVAGAFEIRVADDGPGISPEAQRSLFVPYFSTKPGGSGIGLALARQIVVAHGGTITAERSPSGGTLMRIVVPDVARAHPYREVG